jgi:hypothetical protein
VVNLGFQSRVSEYVDNNIIDKFYTIKKVLEEARIEPRASVFRIHRWNIGVFRKSNNSIWGILNLVSLQC